MKIYYHKIIVLILKFFIYLHNFSYQQISHLAPLAENNVHPKHRLIRYDLFFFKQNPA